MTRDWIRETPATWDGGKAAAFGDLDPELFGLGTPKEGAALGDEWWRVEDDRRVLGYGRLDDTWGDAEILVVVAPEGRGAGVGAFVLEHLEAEADKRHLNYLYNVVRPEHPSAAQVVTWLESHGFAESIDGEFRKHVRGSSPR